MHSPLAADLDRRRRARDSEASPDARVALAFALGHADLVRFAEAQGLGLAEARRQLRRRSQDGRRFSQVMQDANR